jgi:hypothetical protein
VYGDTGVMEMESAMRSIHSGDSGADRQHLILISSGHTMKIHTLSFQTFRLTRSFRDFVDLCNFVDPCGWVVSYLLTFFLRSSSLMLMECEERFCSVTHCNPDASVYPMNPFRRMVTVGHNARVFVYNRQSEKKRQNAETVIGGRYAARHVVLMPGAE